MARYIYKPTAYNNGGEMLALHQECIIQKEMHVSIIPYGNWTKEEVKEAVTEYLRLLEIDLVEFKDGTEGTSKIKKRQTD